MSIDSQDGRGRRRPPRDRRPQHTADCDVILDEQPNHGPPEVSEGTKGTKGTRRERPRIPHTTYRNGRPS